VANGAGNETRQLAGLLIEVERSTKSIPALKNKIAKLVSLIRGNRDECRHLLGTGANKVIYLVGSSYGVNPEGHMRRLLRLCEAADATFFRIASLEAVLALQPAEILRSPVWCRPGEEGPCVL
jgi:hypothetical protein